MSAATQSAARPRVSAWLPRLASAAFLVFLLKGLAWIVVTVLFVIVR